MTSRCSYFRFSQRELCRQPGVCCFLLALAFLFSRKPDRVVQCGSSCVKFFGLSPNKENIGTSVIMCNHTQHRRCSYERVKPATHKSMIRGVAHETFIICRTRFQDLARSPSDFPNLIAAFQRCKKVWSNDEGIRRRVVRPMMSTPLPETQPVVHDRTRKRVSS